MLRAIAHSLRNYPKKKMANGAPLTPTAHAGGMMAYTFCGIKKIAPKVFDFEVRVILCCVVQAEPVKCIQTCVQKCLQLFPDIPSDIGLKFYTDELPFLGGELAEISQEAFEEVANCVNNLNIMLNNEVEIIDGLTETYEGMSLF